jgi:hypothetical protein
VTPAYAFIFGSLVEVFAENNDNDIIYKESVKYALCFVALAVGMGLTSLTQVF